MGRSEKIYENKVKEFDVHFYSGGLLRQFKFKSDSIEVQRLNF